MMKTTQSEKWKIWSAAKNAAGLCGICGKDPVKPGKTSCESCLQKGRNRRTALYHGRLDRGLCPHCGAKREDPGIIGCNSCNQKIGEARVRHYNRSDKALYQRRLLRRREISGMCIICGQRRDDLHFKNCSRCRQHRREVYYKKRDLILAGAHRRHKLNYKPKQLCPVCHLHRLRCDCGKIMKTHHGEGSCLYTCTCGKVTSFASVKVNNRGVREPASTPLLQSDPGDKAMISHPG